MNRARPLLGSVLEGSTLENRVGYWCRSSSDLTLTPTVKNIGEIAISPGKRSPITAQFWRNYYIARKNGRSCNITEAEVAISPAKLQYDHPAISPAKMSHIAAASPPKMHTNCYHHQRILLVRCPIITFHPYW
jgi:hypothetical protein